MKTTQTLLCGLIGLVASTTYAVDVTGTWKGEFDSQIGLQ